MAIEQSTIVNQIIIERDGTVLVRFAKLLVKDGVVLRDGPHRVPFLPGNNFAEQIAGVNDALERMDEAPVAAEEWTRVRRVIELEHTPDVVKAFKEKPRPLPGPPVAPKAPKEN